jgi:phage shock protein C
MEDQAQRSMTQAGPRRLHRSREDRMIAGVCGGLAQYFGVDPVVVRIGAVALALAGGAGLPAYLFAWLLVPRAERGAPAPAPSPAAPVRVFNLVDREPARSAPAAPARG